MSISKSVYRAHNALQDAEILKHENEFYRFYIPGSLSERDEYDVQEVLLIFGGWVIWKRDNKTVRFDGPSIVFKGRFGQDIVVTPYKMSGDVE